MDTRFLRLLFKHALLLNHGSARRVSTFPALFHVKFVSLQRMSEGVPVDRDQVKALVYLPHDGLQGGVHGGAHGRVHSGAHGGVNGGVHGGVHSEVHDGVHGRVRGVYDGVYLHAIFVITLSRTSSNVYSTAKTST